MLGDIDLLIGTHALFQEDVAFHDLALAVVDEQHRFGVHQRLALTQKGEAVDVLVLTATPIPRTLVLTFFGDMDISELREKPAGPPADRHPHYPLCRALKRSRTPSAARLRKASAPIGSARWSKSRKRSTSPLPQARFEELREKFGDKVDLVHGRMKGADKDAAMARFAAGETRLLVATTVIEVGVDVPEATIMVIEHAERFGLAQLHQLRGRIGRGPAHRHVCCFTRRRSAKPQRRGSPFCAKRKTASASPKKICDCAAKATCSARGKAGCPAFRLRGRSCTENISARRATMRRSFLRRDPTLSTPRGEALRQLLYLFGKDEAIKLIRAG